MVAMKSLPFAAKVGEVAQQVSSDLPQLPQSEPDVAQQSYLPEIAKQFKPRMRLGSDHMDVGRTVIVGVDHHTPALEDGKNGGHPPV
jgi:hypothetical protein